MRRLIAGSLLFLLCACASEPQQERVKLPPPPPTGEPTDLVGLSRAQLQASFGVPAFSRRENGSEMWRYDTKTCRVFFFLYPSGRDMAVRHVETMPHAKGIAADPACLTALRAKPASPLS